MSIENYTLFDENGSAIFTTTNDVLVKNKFNQRHKNGFAGWIEDSQGTVVAGRKPVNTAPTWTGMLATLLVLYEAGTPDARAVALEELQRMAKIADSANDKGM